MGGYDQFFKQARRASGLASGSSGSSARPGPEATKKFKVDIGSERSTAAKPPARGRTPEDQLRAELASRLKQKRKKILRKKQQFPVGAVAFVIVSLVVSAVFYYHPDTLEFIEKRVDISLFGRASASSGTSASEEKKDSKHESDPKPNGEAASKSEEKDASPTGANGEKAAASSESAKPGGGLNIRDWSPEELSFFNKLNDRKKELDLREAELNKMEEELQKQKAELDQRIQQLEAMRTEISKTLKTRVASDQEKVDKLVQFYSNMKPQQAAKVIETINEDLAVEVLDKMKKKNAADVLNLMDATKARRLSEMLTGYRRLPSSTDAPTEKETDTAAENKDMKEQ